MINSINRLMKRMGDNVSLSGERIEMFSMLLTESEKTVVDEMRSNYTALKEFKENAEKNDFIQNVKKFLKAKNLLVFLKKIQKETLLIKISRTCIQIWTITLLKI